MVVLQVKHEEGYSLFMKCVAVAGIVCSSAGIDIGALVGTRTTIFYYILLQSYPPTLPPIAQNLP